MARADTWKRSTALAIFAATELALRALDAVVTVLPVGVFESATGSAALSVLAAFLGGDPTGLGLAIKAAQFAFLLATVHRFSPLLLREEFGNWVETRAATLVVTATASLSVAVGFVDAGGVLQNPLVTAGTGAVAFYCLFRARHDDPFDPPDGPVFRVFDTVQKKSPFQGSDGDAVESDRLTLDSDATGVWPKVARALAGLLVVGLLALAATYFGMLVFVVGLFSPLPELFVVGLAVSRYTDSRIGAFDYRSFDAEAAIYGVLSATVTHPLKGFAGLLFLLGGLFTSALSVLAGVGILAVLSVSNLETLAAEPARAFTFLTLMASMFVTGGYGLWYWRSVAARFTALLAPEDDEENRPPPHPAWLSLPQSLLMLASAVAALFAAVYLHRNPELGVWPLWLSLLHSVVLVCCLAFIVHAYRQTEPDDDPDLSAGRWKLPASASIQVVSTAVLATVVANYEAVQAEGLTGLESSVELLVLTVSLVAVALIFYGYPAAMRFAERQEDYRSVVVKFAYPTVLGGSAGVVLLANGDPGLAVAVVALFAVCGGVLAVHDRASEC